MAVEWTVASFGMQIYVSTDNGATWTQTLENGQLH